MPFQYCREPARVRVAAGTGWSLPRSTRTLSVYPVRRTNPLGACPPAHGPVPRTVVGSVLEFPEATQPGPSIAVHPTELAPAAEAIRPANAVDDPPPETSTRPNDCPGTPRVAPLAAPPDVVAPPHPWPAGRPAAHDATMDDFATPLTPEPGLSWRERPAPEIARGAAVPVADLSAGFGGAEEPAALVHQPQRVGGSPQPGDGGGDALAGAVAEHGDRLDAELLELAGEGEPEREQGELLVHQAAQPFLVIAGAQDGADVDAETVVRLGGQGVEHLTEHRQVAVRGAAESGPQHARAGKQEGGVTLGGGPHG